MAATLVHLCGASVLLVMLSPQYLLDLCHHTCSAFAILPLVLLSWYQLCVCRVALLSTPWRQCFCRSASRALRDAAELLLWCELCFATASATMPAVPLPQCLLCFCCRASLALPQPSPQCLSCLAIMPGEPIARPARKKKGRPRAAPFNMSMFVALFQTEGCFFHVLRIGAYKHLEVAGFSAPFQVTIKELKILYRQREGYCFALTFL